jgi:hypothetical protein
MKKRANKILCCAALICMMAPVMAQTVDVTLQCGQTYTINSTAAATAGATYRWLENGSTITGTAANYTVPKTKSVGVYTYIRQAKSEGCADWQNSNAFTVEVKNKNNDGVCIAGVMWAKYNVDEPGSFTANIYDPGKVYQFNSPIPYPPYGPTTWTVTAATYTDGWVAENDPCPSGWHIATNANWNLLSQHSSRRLLDTSLFGISGTLVCVRPSCMPTLKMTDALFLPAVSPRPYSTAGPSNSSYYVTWLPALVSSNPHVLYFSSWIESLWWSVTAACTLRCVQDN